MSPKTVMVLVCLGLASIVGILYFGQIETDPAYTRPPGSNSYSYAATGHKAFVEFLKADGFEVQISQFKTADKNGGNNFVALLEPDLEFINHPLVGDMVESGPILLAAPKWRSRTSRANPSWIQKPRLHDPDIVESLVSSFSPGLKLVRPDTLSPIGGHLPVDRQPVISSPQLFVPHLSITPILYNDDGILMGVIDDGRKRIWLLSDPDILSNMGLQHPENATIILALIREFLPQGTLVVIDETLHGFTRHPSIWSLVLSAPWLAVSAAFLATCLIVLWAAMVRFGSPVHRVTGLVPGKELLIHNTASLFRLGGHDQQVLARYFDNAKTEVSHGLHLPMGLSGPEQVRRLDDIARKRGIKTSLSDLKLMLDRQHRRGPKTDSDPAAAGRAIYQWKMEMLNGSGRN